MGLKVAGMARAIWPHLAGPGKQQPSRGGEREEARGYKPEWGVRPPQPWEAEPRPIPSGLEKVPGLIKVSNRR
jgi:hypothetical protein